MLSRAFNCLPAFSLAALVTVSMTAGAQEPAFPVAPEETNTLAAYVTRTATTDHELVVIEEVEETGGYEVVQSVTPESVTDTLPATASIMPLIGLLGALSAGLGALGFTLRRRLAA